MRGERGCQQNAVNNQRATVELQETAQNSFKAREYLFTLMIKRFIDFLENPIFSLRASENLFLIAAQFRRSVCSNNHL